MDRAEMLERLRELKPWLAEQGIENLRLYGSFARDEAGPESDVDLIVDITKSPMGWEFFGIERQLGEHLGRTVEMATLEAMHRLVRTQALAEAVAV